MLRSVLTKWLWDQRRALLGWTIGITAIGVLYAVFYPTIKTPAFEDAMDAFPPEMMEALGFSDFTSAAGYLGSTTFGLLGPILTIIMATALGASAIAGDEESGRLDLILAHPASRWSVLVQRAVGVAVALVIVAAALTVALIAISGVAELGEIGPADLAAASVHLAGLGAVFAALALAVGAATGRRNLVVGVVAAVAVVTFFGNTLGPAVDWLAWLRDVSPFHYYSGGQPLRNGVAVVDVAVLLVTSVVLVAIGGLALDRRDIAV
jgi:ABC-2 type transport system permease protein